jgi:hypothetical protein
MAISITAKRTALATGLALALAALAGCQTIPRYDAANDIRAFLVAVRDGDAAGFEAHLDRPALKQQLRSRVIAEVAARSGKSGMAVTMGAAMAAPALNTAVDALVRVDTFRAAAILVGYDPSQPLPSPLALTPLVKPLGAGAVCVTESHGGPCLFNFRQEAGAWKLSGFEGALDLKRLRKRRADPAATPTPTPTPAP